MMFIEDEDKTTLTAIITPKSATEEELETLENPERPFTMVF